MTDFHNEPEPERPEPEEDQGHVLPEDIWEAVEAERERLEEEKRNG